LAPKAQIKAIHITRDAFAAENHSSYGTFIDIITQPGTGNEKGQNPRRLWPCLCRRSPRGKAEASPYRNRAVFGRATL
jgi:hypothetical protein